ncbi:DEAD/DEAH box helicase [Candidatus Micrarchaeota archaeon]|nr:DEAD/DEAH box helicase [Candidatus Micrarchaeota archaeon]
MKFEEMDIDDSIKKALKDMKYENATEVQLRTMPDINYGKNVVVRSQTGSGKTSAFGIPLSERIISGKSKYVLIIGPTRELMVQVKNEIKELNKYTNISAYAVYGGHGIVGEIRVLKGSVQILCATPGRLWDHIERKTINPLDFDTVVLDEADRMLDMGFINEIKKILGVVKPKNIHMFSATLDGRVAKLINKYITKYEEVILKDEIVGVDIIEKKITVPKEEKFTELVAHLKKAKGKRVLVFVSTKRYADKLKEKLSRMDFRATCIHGDLTQRKREVALENFKSKKKNVLIATDVAARGLQIDNVGYVINYDEAMDADTHRHRIGRTGRMGKMGYAITFLDSYDDRRSRKRGVGREGREHKRRRRYESRRPRRR